MLRFLDAPGGIPDRYGTMLAGSIAFVAIGKAIVFEVLGLHRKWWRYFQLPDLWPVVRASAVASVLLVAVFTLAKPYAYSLPRSVVVFDFLLTILLLGGARLPAHDRRASRRGRRAAPGARRARSSAPGSGGQMVVRELKLNPEPRRPGDRLRRRRPAQARHDRRRA